MPIRGRVRQQDLGDTLELGDRLGDAPAALACDQHLRAGLERAPAERIGRRQEIIFRAIEEAKP